MGLTLEMIATLKKVILAYWASVFVVAVFFIDSSFGQKYLLFALLVLLAHVLETFVFHSQLESHSQNVIKDKVLMLPFGYLIPAELKLKNTNTE